jgi:hypothetical protein
LEWISSTQQHQHHNTATSNSIGEIVWKACGYVATEEPGIGDSKPTDPYRCDPSVRQDYQHIHKQLRRLVHIHIYNIISIINSNKGA